MSAEQNKESMFYLALPIIKYKTRDKKQCRQEILAFDLMRRVSLKHHI